MSKAIAESAIDVYFSPKEWPLSIESLNELKASKQQPYVYYDCDLYAYICLQHATINREFISHLEIRILITISTQDSVDLIKNEKVPWYSDNEYAFYWNGYMACDDQLFLKDGDMALIPVKLCLPSAQHTIGNTAMFTISLMWKPAKSSSPATNEPKFQSLDSIDSDFYLYTALDDALVSINMEKGKGLNTPVSLIPVRRTTRRTLEIHPPFVANLETTPIEHDKVLLLFDIENTSDLLLKVDEINIKVSGARVSPISTDSESFPSGGLRKEKSDLSFVEVQRPNSFIKDRIKHSIVCVEGKLIADDFHIPISSTWKLGFDSDGQVMVVPFNEKGHYKIVTEQPDMTFQGVSMTFTVCSENIVLMKDFDIELVVFNHTRKTRNLQLEFPKASRLTPEMLQSMVERSQCIHLSSIDMVELYDQWQSESSPLICLDYRVDIKDIKPREFKSVRLKFIAIKGAGSLQNIDYVKCIDLDTKVECELENICQGILINK